MRRALLFAVLFAASLLGSCAADDPVGRPVTATDGQELFSLRALGSQAGCVTCHSLTPDHIIVGPSLAGLAERAGGRVGHLDARAYVNESITSPDAYVVDGFESGKMPPILAEVLSPQQIDALIDYLLAVT
jgi:cytochrome c551/c552